MVEADRCGVPSHGVLMLPRLSPGCATGGRTGVPTCASCATTAPPACSMATAAPGAIVSVDGDGARRSTGARAHGVGVCLARNTTHWGRAHAYAARAARAGMLGLCTTNAIPTMMAARRAEGGARQQPDRDGRAARRRAGPRRAGPRDVAGGAREGGHPCARRPADSRRTGARIARARRRGTRPRFWRRGCCCRWAATRGSASPSCWSCSRPRSAGSAFGHEIAAGRRDRARPRRREAVPRALDRPHSATRPRSNGASTRMLDYLHRAAPEHPVLAPGERGWRARDEYDRDGIPIHADVVAQLASVGVRLTSPVRTMTEPSFNRGCCVIRPDPGSIEAVGLQAGIDGRARARGAASCCTRHSCSRDRCCITTSRVIRPRPRTARRASPASAGPDVPAAHRPAPRLMDAGATPGIGLARACRIRSTRPPAARRPQRPCSGGFPPTTAGRRIRTHRARTR